MAKKNKNLVAQIVASFALLAIVLSIVGTGIFVVFSSMNPETNSTYEMTPEQLQELTEMYENQEPEVVKQEEAVREQLEESFDASGTVETENP